MILVKIAENIPSSFVCFFFAKCLPFGVFVSSYVHSGWKPAVRPQSGVKPGECVCMRVTVQGQGRGRSGFVTFTAARIRGGGQLEGSMAYIAAGHMG